MQSGARIRTSDITGRHRLDNRYNNDNINIICERFRWLGRNLILQLRAKKKKKYCVGSSGLEWT
jgi:hypothetical protein